MSALRLSCSPSPRLAVLLVVLHAAAAGAALAAWPGWTGAALAAALLAAGLAAAWSRALLGSRRSVRVLELDGQTVVVQLADGTRLQAPLPARRYVSRFAVALPLGGGVRRTLFIAADMLDAQSFRALRLWGLWGRLPPRRQPTVAGKQLPA